MRYAVGKSEGEQANEHSGIVGFPWKSFQYGRSGGTERPQLILHLGDCWPGCGAPCRAVSEYSHGARPRQLRLPPGGTGGEAAVFRGLPGADLPRHTYGSRPPCWAAGLKAEQDQLDAFLFGHTHKPLIDRRGKTLFLNPGSVGKGLRPTYAVLTAEGGKLDGRTAFLD